MKKNKFHIILFALCIVLGVNARAMVSYKESVILSKKERKNMIVYFYREHCPYCHQMDMYVLPDKEVENLIHTSFIFVTLDLDSDEGHLVAEKFGVSVSPTFLILSPENKLVFEIQGSMEKEIFLNELIKYKKAK